MAVFEIQRQTRGKSTRQDGRLRLVALSIRYLGKFVERFGSVILRGTEGSRKIENQTGDHYGHR